MILSTHASKLERWLGPEEVNRLSQAMNDPKGNKWYGPPIAVANVPGSVYAMPDGDFKGFIGAGQFSSLIDFTLDRMKRTVRTWTKRQLVTTNTGFSSLSDLIAKASTGKRQELAYSKLLAAQTLGAASSLWRLGASPAAGLGAAVDGVGSIPTNATTGALPYVLPSAPDTLHYIGSGINHTTTGTVLLYDRLFHVGKTLNIITSETVTPGTVGRYASTTTTAMNYAGGNFIFPEVGATALAATGHNWDAVKYTNQAGVAGQTCPITAGIASNPADRLDLPVGSWYLPLATGDTGLTALTAMKQDASLASGALDFVVGRPLAWMPCPIALVWMKDDGINTAFNLVRIFDNACMTFLNVCAASASVPAITGTITLVAG